MVGAEEAGEEGVVVELPVSSAPFPTWMQQQQRAKMSHSSFPKQREEHTAFLPAEERETKIGKKERGKVMSKRKAGYSHQWREVGAEEEEGEEEDVIRYLERAVRRWSGQGLRWTPRPNDEARAAKQEKQKGGIISQVRER